MLFVAVILGLRAQGSLAAPAPAGAIAGPAPNSLLLPPSTDGGPVKVSVALHVLNLSDINEVKERFDLTGYLLADWYDPRLAYQQTGAADWFRALVPASVWHPQLVLVNSAAPRHSFETALKVTPDGKVEYTERFGATMTSTFALRAFPFDTQKLDVIVHPFITQQSMVAFVARDWAVWTAAEFSSYSSLESWEFRSLSSSLGESRTARGRPISEARFVLTVQRRVPFYIWKVFLPLLLMVIVSWAVFWFDPGEVSSQVQIAVTTILTIIAFAFAIALTLPRVPYLTFADGFFLSCYVFAFLAMAELTAVHVAYRKQHRELALRIRYNARWVVPASFAITVAALIAHFLL